MGLLLTWVFSSLSLLGGAYLLPGVSVESFGVAMLVALLLGLVSVTLKPILKILTLPINILTLGLFGLVVNGLLILLVDSLVAGFSVEGLLSAILLSLITSLLMAVFGGLVKDETVK
jgi:putative membrane protein